MLLVRVLPSGSLACSSPSQVNSMTSADSRGRAWGKGFAPFLFLQELMYGAFKVCVYSFLVFLALAVLLACVAYVIAVVSGSTSGFKKEKASYFTNAEKLKVGYTSRTRIRRATTGEGI
ncbi:hypothetical protein ZWY2020_032776 [Hordeum vulgare]|nr:hypothetical protein ZWY2020_032776 [Hordeum vulgare]